MAALTLGHDKERLVSSWLVPFKPRSARKGLALGANRMFAGSAWASQLPPGLAPAPAHAGIGAMREIDGQALRTDNGVNPFLTSLPRERHRLPDRPLSAAKETSSNRLQYGRE